MAPKSDLAETSAAETAAVAAVENWGGYATFDALAEGADSTASRDVFTSADEKDELVNLAFVVTGITFRPSDKKEGGDYVSLEATTKDNAQIVINDGSTGIRRQVMAYLAFKGIIVPGELKDDDTDVKDRCDLPVSRAELGEGCDATFDDNGGMTVNVTAPVRLLAKKGLRRSDYQGPTGSATTFYLA